MTMAREYITTKDCAKLVRKALKEAFPGQKFSVRSDMYAGGSSIRVHWYDGPTEETVNAVSRQFAGSTFDGMIDMASTRNLTLNGSPVTLCVDYVFASRDLTDGYKAKAEQRFSKLDKDSQRAAAFDHQNHSEWYSLAWLWFDQQQMKAQPSTTANSLRCLPDQENAVPPGYPAQCTDKNDSPSLGAIALTGQAPKTNLL